MELSLNAVWLMFAVAGTYLCARHQFALRRSWREFAQALLATTILCVFLFPVISATDDLHPAQAVIEESASRKAISAVHAAHLGDLSSHLAVFLLAFLLLLIPPTLFLHGRMVDSSTSVALAVATDLHRGRAPPTFVR